MFEASSSQAPEKEDSKFKVIFGVRNKKRKTLLLGQKVDSDGGERYEKQKNARGFKPLLHINVSF